MTQPTPVPQHAVAFQLAAVLEELDLEVARLQLHARARTFLSHVREQLAKVRQYNTQLGIPEAAADALAKVLNDIHRELGKPDAERDLTPLMAEQRQVTQNLRNRCMEILTNGA
jgi:hypothetical protein